MQPSPTPCWTSRPARLLSIHLFALLLVLLTAGPTIAQQTQPAVFEARLLGANEVPTVTQAGTGSVTAVLNDLKLHVTGSFSGLQGDFTAAHLHRAAIGENGPPVFTLEPVLADDNRSGTFHQTFTLTEVQVEDLINGSLYVNVHSAIHPGGEIRGQLLPAATQYFSISLFGGVASPAFGRALAILDGSELRLFGHFVNLIGTYTSSSLHIGSDEADGPVVTLTANVDENQHGGTLLAHRNIIGLTDDLVDQIQSGQLSMRVYSSVQTSSEIQGLFQPAAPGLSVYEAVMTGINEVPSLNTPALGRVTVLLGAPSAIDQSIQVFGSFERLEGTVTAVHIHIGAVGETGDAVVTLPILPASDNRSGLLRLLDHPLPSSLVEALRAGRLYVNVHSSAHPSGEVRGQLLPARSRALSVPLSGEAAVPPVSTPATGRVTLLVRGNEARLTGQFSGLEGDFSNASLHFAAAGETGPPRGSVQPTLALDQRSGFFLVSTENTVYLTDAEFEAWQAGHLYLNLASTAHAAELRGQFEGDPLTDVDDEHDVPKTFTVDGNYPNPFNPSTHIVFDAPATGSVHVEVFDLLGRRVLALPPQGVDAGPARTFFIDAGTLPSGPYLYRVVLQHQGGVQTATGRMLLIK